MYSTRESELNIVHGIILINETYPLKNIVFQLLIFQYHSNMSSRFTSSKKMDDQEPELRAGNAHESFSLSDLTVQPSIYGIVSDNVFL